jgi:hypothetical protein
MRGAAVSSYSGGCAKRLAWPVCHAWNTRAATVVDVARRDRRSKYTTIKLSVWRTAAASGAAASADTGSVAAGQGPRQQQQELVPQQQQLQQGKDKAPLLPVTVISGFLGVSQPVAQATLISPRVRTCAHTQGLSVECASTTQDNTQQCSPVQYSTV